MDLLFNLLDKNFSNKYKKLVNDNFLVLITKIIDNQILEWLSGLLVYLPKFGKKSLIYLARKSPLKILLS